MSRRNATRLARVLWGLVVTILAATLVLVFLNRSEGVDWLLVGLGLVIGVGYGTVGALVASRQPRNPIGWMFCGMALAMMLYAFREPYLVRGTIVAPGSLPATAFVAWLGGWSALAAVLCVPIVFLLFPTGSVPGPRWRPVLWGGVAVIVLAVVGNILIPGPLGGLIDERIRIGNPTGVGALKGVVDAMFGVAFFAWPALAILSIVAMVLRFRRARAVERQQIKWLAYVGSAAGLSLVFFMIVGFALPDPSALGERLGDVGFDLELFILTVGIPVASGIAILRYRLYDIDRIINRTLVYGLLTAVLAGVYVALAVGLGSVAGRDNSVVIAGSTLVVAALFRPARRRIQRLIDRRFYRRRYDAQRTLEAFTARLRSEVDLDELQDHLVGVVQEAMQPAHTSLWLRRESP
jgi:hypothetical protein